MTAADDETRAALADRYGLGPGAVTRRRRWLAVGVLAGAAVIAFVVLAIVSTDRAVRTEDASFTVVDETAVNVGFVVHMDPGTTAQCTVLALNDSFAQVGVARVAVGPEDERTTLHTTRVATTEPATGARVSGCRETGHSGG